MRNKNQISILSSIRLNNLSETEQFVMIVRMIPLSSGIVGPRVPRVEIYLFFYQQYRCIQLYTCVYHDGGYRYQFVGCLMLPTVSCFGVDVTVCQTSTPDCCSND